jgi:hypothetical protein
VFPNARGNPHCLEQFPPHALEVALEACRAARHKVPRPQSHVRDAPVDERRAPEDRERERFGHSSIAITHDTYPGRCCWS